MNYSASVAQPPIADSYPGETMGHRVLIVGAAFVNKGAEAMIRCVQRGIISRIPGASGILDVPPGASWSREELRGLHPRVGLTFAERSRRAAATVARCLGRVASRRVRVRWLEAASGVDFGIDAVVDISGYAWGDPWVRQASTGWGAELRSAISRALVSDPQALMAAGAPFIYLPQCWGPFERCAARRRADDIVRTATKLYARDQESLDWLTMLHSFSSEKVALASDIAFTFEGAPAEEARTLLTELGIRFDGTPIVGIVPNMRVYERASGDGADSLYVRELVRIAVHFAERIGCQVVVMPHEIKLRPVAVPDDRYLCRLVSEAAADAGTVCAAVAEYSSEELKAMIGEVDLLVSSRFHSIVAAMSLRVPVVSIAWSHKYRELMESVGLGGYVVEQEDLADSSLVDLCDQAWAEREHLAASLEAHVPKHEASAHAVLEETAALIREREPLR